MMCKTLSSCERSKPKLLVTGASGLLGHAISTLAVAQWSVLALYRRNMPQVPGVTPIQFDLTDKTALKGLVRDLAPKAVVHAAAAAQVGECESHPGRTAVINVDVPVLLADLCAESGTDYLFTSTDLVFDGQQAPYDEQDPVAPICTYGQQKARAERAVLEHFPQALVCRLPLMFGMAPFSGNHFTLQMLKGFMRGETATLLTDEYRTPVDNYSAAQGILHLLGRAQGLLHLGGRTRVSRYDLGRLMASCMAVGPDVIRPVTIKELGLKVARAPDCALVSDKAYALGYAPAPLKTAVRALVDQFSVISNG